MSFGACAKPALVYRGTAATSGSNGARTTPMTALDGDPTASSLIHVVRDSWRPAAVGAYIGALAASLGQKGKPAYGTVLLSGLLGATIGVTSRATWGPRA
jgi:hypothetical protein